MKKNSLRIIGGQYRSRILTFPDVEGLRPTGDRIRETLFNWLAPYIADSICLDLFAGSGALGFEALSRGAKHVTFVDQSTKACESLRSNLLLLGETRGHIICSDASLALSRLTQPLDIIFLDPPFASNALPPICEALENSSVLNPGALIYLEHAKNHAPNPLPVNWEIIKTKQSGKVCYLLYRRG